MPDAFASYATGLTSPLTESEQADVSSGDHAFTNTTRAVLFTSDGDATVRLAGDRADLTLTVTAGTFLPFRVTHVRQSSTAGVLGLW